MNIDDVVLEFIRNARYSVHTNNLSETEEARLKALFDDCLSLVANHHNKALIPTFILCDTYNKYSAVLPVRFKRNEYKYYLLYDIHLNRINRLLNAIYFSDQDSGHDIWKLSYQLFAEDSLLEEDEVLLSYFGLNKAALGSFEIAENSQADLNFILDIQERYIIGHELGHWIYKVLANTDISSIANIGFCEDPYMLLTDIKELLSELYKAYEKLFEKKEYVKLIHEQKELVLKNDGILGECFADAVAYAIVFAYVQIKYPNNKERLLLAGQSLFLEMMNLHLLAMQHMAVVEESFESSTSVRLGFLRNYAHLYFEENGELFNSMLEETVLRYEERITNPMLECFAELEQRADNIHSALKDVDGQLNMGFILDV
ncbi:hypothetical protein I5Q82_02860 [Acutalibacter muris]|uniref:Peptidase M48 domain-containing protein n=1 Tax=Acutalibacter muris TaxID=1796620 RepID=A0A1Z2XSR1_9FIRM|nr:hypothetical protein [Acutalibacter muris]ANU55355.1 hypothetical protein A4V00_15780 [Hungateiclostridiaceae bacterium KB18]ASB41411.1 hypothetical protein ADH66_12555 [Acutalibacter muris]QQR30670.1 hypothetical protein I5Q82_02860 [Acutalibacter muris]